jgi:hypothetical protein
MLNAVMLNVVMLNVIMLNVVILNAVMLNVVVPMLMQSNQMHASFLRIRKNQLLV